MTELAEVEEELFEEVEQEAPKAEDDELVVTFGDEAEGETEPQDASAPEWVKGLRQKTKEQARRIAELEAAQPKTEDQLGPEPTLESCDYEGDAYKEKLLAWIEKKRKLEEGQTAQQRQAQAEQQEWQETLDELKAKERELKAPDYEAARDEFTSSLNNVQQAVIIKAAKNSAQVIYALGKHPARLAQVASIRDPIKLAVAIVELERGMKVVSKRTAVEPETIVRGSARVSNTSGQFEKEYERLITNGTADQRKAFRERHNLDIKGKVKPK